MLSTVFLDLLKRTLLILRDTFENWQIFIALCFATCTVIVLLLLRCALFRRKYNKLWPGKKYEFLNLFGSFSDIKRSENERNGFPILVSILEALSGSAHLFKDEPIWVFWISYWPFIYTNKAETVEAILGTTKHLDKGWIYSWLQPWLGSGILTSQVSKWKSRRKLLTSSFHSNILKEFLPVFNEKAHLLVKNLLEETLKDSTDITILVTLCSLDIICESALGVTVDALRTKESQYLESVKRVGEIIYLRFESVFYLVDFTFNFTKLGKEFNRHIKILHNFTMSAIKEKKRKFFIDNQDIGRTKKRIALMDLLLEHHIKTQSFTEEDVKEEVDTFAFAGHDTVSVAITWALYLIGLHRDVQEKIHEELYSIFGTDTESHASTEDLKDMKYLDCVLKESQRLYPSIPIMARKISEDTTISGYSIPEGVSFFVNVYALHRDERWFTDPEKFDPDRFLPEDCTNRHPFAYIPFSAGPRNCIGKTYAQMEMKIVVSTILRNYTVQSLDQRDKLPPSPEIVLKSPLPIRVKIRLREEMLYNQN